MIEGKGEELLGVLFIIQVLQPLSLAFKEAGETACSAVLAVNKLCA